MAKRWSVGGACVRCGSPVLLRGLASETPETKRTCLCAPLGAVLGGGSGGYFGGSPYVTPQPYAPLGGQGGGPERNGGAGGAIAVPGEIIWTSPVYGSNTGGH